MNIKQIKKELKITDDDIAKMAGYSSGMSYRNNSAKPRLERFIEQLYQLIKDKEK